MKLVKLSIVITVFVVCHQTIAAVLSGSEDLSKALEELRRRRRWLESSVPLEYEPSHHEYGTINHFTPDMRKRQLQWGPAMSKASLVPFLQDEDDKRKKKSAVKRSSFRERQQLDEPDKKRKRWESDGDYDDTWQQSEAEELLKNLAQRRFLSSLLGRAQQEQARQTNQVPKYDRSLELDQMGENDVMELMELLRKQQGDSAETKYYMEGEAGGESSDEDEIDRKKKLLALNKRLIWQDGIRYSLGDTPPSKRQYTVDDESAEEPWWVRVDPRLVELLENSAEDERKMKREPDPWFPAFDVDEKKRYYQPMSGSWAKRKRGSVFRERVEGLGAGSMRRKRLSAFKKRIPEEMTQERKRIVKKSIPEVSEKEEKIMDELKTIMADEKTPKVHRRNVDEDISTDEELEPLADSDESPLSDYFGYDRRNPNMKKRKRTWDDYAGIDKRGDPMIHDDHDDHDEELKSTLQPEADHMKRGTDKPEVEEKGQELDNSTEKDAATTLISVDEERKVEKVEKDDEEEEETVEKRLNREKMQRYFSSIAAAMSVKKKRASELHEESNEEPLEAMDRRLEAIENLMLQEALALVESNREPSDEERSELRDKIVHRLDAAHSLEKVRQGLAQFDNSLDLIRKDREEDDDDNDDDDEKKKKSLIKKQSMSEALHVTAPDTDKRNELNSDEEDESTCQIFGQIVNLCQDLNKAAGDSRGALVDACSRHIMCYACDYAYKDSPQIPCDLIFMREGHDICGDDVHCRSAAAQMHGILRQRAKVTQRANEAVCLSESCVRAYLKHRK